MRAFVGLRVPDPWIAPLMRARARIPGGRPVPAEDLHLTLAFLDDRPADQLEALHDALEGMRMPAVALQAAGFAVLGAGRARLVALDVAAAPDLAALRDGVRGAARAAGIDLPRERFRPHVTLVRYPGAARFDAGRLAGALAEMGAPGMAPAMAHALTLWSSTLTPDGPVYEALAAYPLAAPGASGRNPSGRGALARRGGDA